MRSIPHPGSASAANAVWRLARAFAGDEAATSSAEYALMLMVLAGCALVALHHIGGSAGRIMIHVANALQHP